MKYLKIFLVTGLLISFFLYCAYLYLSSFERFIKYLKNNPDKFSLVATVDDKLVYQNNGEKLFYIASTKKILILVELASQIQSGLIKDVKSLPLLNIDKFYLKGLDGGAHEKWKEKLFSNKIKSNVTLDEVVNGMIEYSSNACTDYILNLVTIDSVNARAKKFGASSPLNYLYCNSLILEDSLILIHANYKKLKSSNEEIFNKMKASKIKISNIHPSIEFQELLITRTEKATTKDFQIIIKSIYENKNNSISNKYVKRHLNWIITKKNNSKFYKYFGGKGGSLIGVLTYSCFAINNANESVNFNFFINDMDFPDWYLMQDSFIEFRNRFCKSKSERDLLLSKLQ